MSLVFFLLVCTVFVALFVHACLSLQAVAEPRGCAVVNSLVSVVPCVRFYRGSAARVANDVHVVIFFRTCAVRGPLLLLFPIAVGQDGGSRSHDHALHRAAVPVQVSRVSGSHEKKMPCAYLLLASLLFLLSVFLFSFSFCCPVSRSFLAVLCWKYLGFVVPRVFLFFTLSRSKCLELESHHMNRPCNVE